MIPTYDTISYKNNDSTSADKLILSEDEIPRRFTPEEHAAKLLSSGGQNIYACPEKLFFKKGRLYNIKNGLLVSKKQKALWSGKKWHPWFFKKTD